MLPRMRNPPRRTNARMKQCNEFMKEGWSHECTNEGSCKFRRILINFNAYNILKKLPSNKTTNLKSNSTKLYPVLAIFILASSSILFIKEWLNSKGFDTDVLLAANLFFLIIHLGSFFMQRKSLSNDNPNVFIRAVMGGMMLKIFSCIIVVFIYVSILGDSYNKRSLFTALLLYLFYLAAEVFAITKSLKKNSNA